MSTSLVAIEVGLVATGDFTGVDAIHAAPTKARLATPESGFRASGLPRANLRSVRHELGDAAFGDAENGRSISYGKTSEPQLTDEVPRGLRCLLLRDLRSFCLCPYRMDQILQATQVGMDGHLCGFGVGNLVSSQVVADHCFGVGKQAGLGHSDPVDVELPAVFPPFGVNGVSHQIHPSGRQAIRLWMSLMTPGLMSRWRGRFAVCWPHGHRHFSWLPRPLLATGEQPEACNAATTCWRLFPATMTVVYRG